MEGSILQDFEKAIVAAFSGAAGGLAAQATAYCQQVRELPDGWKYAMQLAMSSESHEVQFYCLGTLQDAFVTGRYGALSKEDQLQMRQVFMQWIAADGARIGGLPAFVRTKVALIVTLLLKHQYPEMWPEAFADLLGMLNGGPPFIDLFLRVLGLVDEEIVRYNAQRQSDEIKHNSLIKDAMRAADVLRSIVDACYQIVTTFKDSEDAGLRSLGVMAVAAIKEYAGWVDISLVANAPMAELYTALLESEDTRDGVADVFYQLVHRGMVSPLSKVGLIRELRLIDLLEHHILRQLKLKPARGSTIFPSFLRLRCSSRGASNARLFFVNCLVRHGGRQRCRDVPLATLCEHGLVMGGDLRGDV